MFRYIHQLLQMITPSVARLISAFGNAEQPGQTSSGADTEPPPLRQLNLPPFSGGTEEAALLLALPPTHLIKQRFMARVDKNGTIPESAEEIKLTSAGKAVAKSTFSTIDSQGNIGAADQLKGLCKHCRQFSFSGNPCFQCGQFTCPTCIRRINDPAGQTLLCPECEGLWRWEKINW